MPSTKPKNAKYCSDKCRNKAGHRKFMETKSPEERSAHYKKRNAAYRAKPYGKYVDHRNHARHRGIEFMISFEEWWEMWEPFWDKRGPGGYVMCRTKDQGPYAVGNVRIDTHRNNVLEARGLLKRLN